MDIRDRDEDDEWFQFIIEEKCGFDFDEYLLNIKSFTREDLEPYLDIIINAIVEYENAYLGFQILALLILETEAILPKEVKESVLWSTNWEFDKGLGVWPESENLRKFCLSDFREKIKNYAPGKRIYLSDLKIAFDSEFEKACIGIELLVKLVRSGEIVAYNYVNLDHCNLNIIPESIFELTHLTLLSLEHNNLTEIPEEIGNLVNLEFLWFDYNNVEHLPNTLIKLKMPANICLLNNKIRALSKVLKESNLNIIY